MPEVMDSWGNGRHNGQHLVPVESRTEWIWIARDVKNKDEIGYMFVRKDISVMSFCCRPEYT